MSLSVTSAVRQGGAQCDHLEVTVNVEGVTRTEVTSFTAIDSMLGTMSNAEKIRMLVLLWGWYRRKEGRALTGVDIA